ncbi:MAG: hypothetical protein GT601_08145 [Acidaminobacter sp.]|uniref:hypothetical protein n=1 Tax=Acidaminobacter sp. TaxID=1872102 RepID=UPI00137EAA14|nr:hypothetical protein [Acidaminobacter sp.]MZQ97634.1 hypothetical protein [Acidaminobacter sp.]
MDQTVAELLKKLNVKDQTTLFALNAPEEFERVLTQWRDQLTVLADPPGAPCPFVLIFARDQAQLEESKPILKSAMDPSGLIWVAYPKKSSKRYKSDLSRDDFWDALKDLGLEPVRQIALDEDWSALRFKLGSEIKRKNQ